MDDDTAPTAGWVRGDWRARWPLNVEAGTFWSTALGAVLLVRAGAHGTADDLDLTGALTIHDEPDPGDVASARRSM
ncbi:TetR/AcrR family transcriptional regulator C-terminal domain-containing protein [Kitasatospora cathayae]|uniref:Tetracyclin repressor-like C-terminal domain-containing protein n=1 Tax=Kitasatospora cathayae TaxID=3004092 RepID=A0ABY7QGX6_9ACTN|nr:TetR/AcrR family transcriptional regulator C-terminal domain-containing protein [Kitasatospora sp. HUAS 3-15]WBP91386.1 hypothetical protein O1G21_39585 [Kitasatospora sp. HUAS 3-15]